MQLTNRFISRLALLIVSIMVLCGLGGGALLLLVIAPVTGSLILVAFACLVVSFWATNEHAST